ncbi:energy transducer TonB [Rhodanobacter sp. B05]|jgi:protein TonB|uniref:energy transducer TonB n=1 Tax=Rhodanobacter sp. B05 TaxID=1945859 RepID=UPI0009873A30|nr:energy transducer TonB [Rhodanobacter sp. B05]OOG54028.1 energy transducer TonB [Rhodanobacter sp. B05]
MSSANLALTHRAHPEPARIAALSAAIALNLAVIMIATRPVSPPHFALIRQLEPAAHIRFIPPPPVLAPPPPVELKPLLQPPVVPQVLPRTTPIDAPVVVSNPEGRIAAPVSPTTAAPTGVAAATVIPAPVEASLAYLADPLQYPIQALRQRMHGTVLLRVLVDETGKPLEVSVARGSGHTVLDRSAREQVLSSWRFKPAMVNGRAVRAWATVPVTFAMRG